MEIKSRVPGVVQEVKVKVGDEVNKMDVLLVLEAMKMIQNVPSPVAGEVTEINVEVGDRVKAGQVMVVVE